jgi:hypothetical protein
MIHKAKDLSPEQKTAVENLLGRSLAPIETISIQVIPPPAVPEWLQRSWENVKQQGLDQLSEEEIEAEIAAARKARREKQPGQ